MKTLSIPSLLEKKSISTQEELIHFYNEATEDYEFWSKDFNMHFGYYIPFKTSLFSRDTMLNEMTWQVCKRLQFPKDKSLIVDLGCGLGGSMSFMLHKYPKIRMIGVTLSPFQVREGNKRLKDSNGLILEENYLNTSLSSNSADGVYAMESLCHSGHDIASLQEAYRILKPGKRVVITDAFLKKNADQLCIGSHYCYQQLCKGWSLAGLSTIKQLQDNLYQIGFKNVHIENISYRVAPSVLHVPFAISGFILKKMLNRKPLKPQSIKNLKGSLFALLSGLHMNSFGYYIITAEK